MKNYLVSYGHSGNTWFRYCIEYITKKPTHGHRAFSISERKDNLLRINVSDEPILIKRHTLEDITNNDNFILLLRDPSECIKSDQDVNKEFLKYYSLIQGYDLHTGPKSVIYYDGIFSNDWMKLFIYSNPLFDAEMFCNRIEDLLVNWEHHKSECLNIYNNIIKKDGADLSSIPSIFLEHELIKNNCSSIHF